MCCIKRFKVVPSGTQAQIIGGRTKPPPYNASQAVSFKTTVDAFRGLSEVTPPDYENSNN